MTFTPVDEMLMDVPLWIRQAIAVSLCVTMLPLIVREMVRTR